MTITTKYNLDQKVYTRQDGIFPREARIEKIVIQVGESRINGDAPRIDYKIEDFPSWIPESAIYGTIAEAKEDVLKAVEYAFKELEEGK